MVDENKEEKTLDEGEIFEPSEEEASEEETPKETPKEAPKDTPKEVFKKEEEEPPVRIPKEQSTEDKRLGYKVRMLEKEIKNLKSSGYDEYGEEVPRDSVDDLRAEFNQKFAEIEDKRESEVILQSFLDQYPDYKKYSTKIRKYMNHPAYQQVPIGFIADGIAGQDIARENKKAENEADERAKETKTGGSSYRKTPTGKVPDIWGMSKEEFRAYQNEVRQKGRE